MKQYEFLINKAYLSTFFPHKRVKTKVDVLIILMETIKYMKSNPIVSATDSVGKIVLTIDKMSRLFFFTDKKYYSIVFPFFTETIDIDDEKDSDDELSLNTTREEQQKLSFSFKNQINIDEVLVSNVLSLIKCDEFTNNCSLEFITPICQYNDEYDKNFWPFLRELLFMEDGYIRFDNDKDNYDKAKEKGEEHRHPLNHYDVFYSGNTTFKIGLSKYLKEFEFVDFLNSNTDCIYLKH